ncbi:MAG: O-antigen ligase family protein, partial [Candidatus Shapirobacteria bacterium]
PVYLGLALTYSRSSLLAFLIVFIFISIKTKKLLLFLSTLLIVFLTIILLPRMPGEGTKLERISSIKAKIANYQSGIKLFTTSPIIGLGYNNLPTVRPDKNSHANSGFDSSLLTIAVTTGLIGLFLFFKIFISSHYSSSLYRQSLLLAVFIHSLFANSLLYPWILFFLIFEFKYRKSP